MKKLHRELLALVGIYSADTIARKVGCSTEGIEYALARGSLPQPTLRLERDGEQYWTVDDGKTVLREYTGRPLYSYTRAARELRTTVHILQNLVVAGRIPAPSHGPGACKRWDEADLGRIRRVLAGVPPRDQRQWQRLRDQGLWSRRATARRLGVPEPTLQMWLRTGEIPAPTHLSAAGGTHRYWDEEDVRALAAWMAERGYTRQPYRARKPAPGVPTADGDVAEAGA